MAYTHAYSTFAVRSVVNPDLPNNAGSLAPITVSAPGNCIVNAKYPVPVNARHVVGMYVPFPILNALSKVIPERILAEGSGAPDPSANILSGITFESAFKIGNGTYIPTTCLALTGTGYFALTIQLPGALTVMGARLPALFGRSGLTTLLTAKVL